MLQCLELWYSPSGSPVEERLALTERHLTELLKRDNFAEVKVHLRHDGFQKSWQGQLSTAGYSVPGTRSRE